MPAVVYAPELPPLETADCPRCAGYRFVEDAEGYDCECRACGGSGVIEVCSGCKQVPGVEHGVEVCGCSVLVLELPEVA